MSHQHEIGQVKRILGWASLLVAITIAAIIFDRLTGCSVEREREIIREQTPPVTITDVETSTETSTETDTETATETSIETSTSTSTDTRRDPRPCSQVTTFDEVQPKLAQACVGCHSGIDVYERARGWWTTAPSGPGIIVRVKLPETDPRHMPKGGVLSDDEIDVMEWWQSDGFLKAEECSAGNDDPKPPLPMELAQAEAIMFADALNQLIDQGDTRYLIYIDRINAGASVADLAVAKSAAAKGSASVSPARGLFPPVEIAPGILRINIADLNLDGDKWRLIEQASLLNLESFTTTGVALKQLTNSRLPWLLVSEFNDTVLRNAAVYYALTDSPATFQELAAKVGANVDKDIKEFKALQLGFNGSLLSPAANRLMLRVDAEDTAGYFWTTFDTGPINDDRQNLFKNPLLFQAGGRANLRFAAGETLYTLPNGMMGAFLALARPVVVLGRVEFELNRRLDFADPNVVHDFTSNPVSPIIRNSISCFRCHAAGMIRAKDEVQVSGLAADDAQRARALFRGQAEADRRFAADSGQYAQALRRIGVDPTLPDPITKLSDKLLGDLNLADVAGIFLQTANEFAECIKISDDGEDQAGQLLTGGSISHDQLVQVKDALIRDCRLFQNPLN